ncbi:MAG: thiol-disulfide oxidoreductase DCC family protein [Magnetovibrionaceae bacterium]
MKTGTADARRETSVGKAAGVPDGCLTVFYDGSCPLCRREIDFYKRRARAERVRWEDVSQWKDSTPQPDLDREVAMGRFHVRDVDGRLVSGGVAFAALWRSVPGFRLLGRIGQWPPAAFVLDRFYELFLRFRPWMQRRFKDRG